MRSLFVGFRAPGHLNGLAAIAKSVEARGISVGGQFTEQRYAGERPHNWLWSLDGGGATVSPQAESRLVECGGVHELLREVLIRPVKRDTQVVLEAIDQFRPDAIVCDSIAYRGAIAAQLRNIPFATVGVTAMQLPPYDGYTLDCDGLESEIKEVWDSFDLLPPVVRRVEMASPDLNLVLSCDDSVPRRGTVLVGPCIDETLEAKKAESFTEQGLPMIYVSMGTLVGYRKELWQTFFDALGGESYRVIAGIGELAGDPEFLKSVPANWVVHRNIPQLQVLRSASLAITHGGNNTVNECLYFGVPMVVIPLCFDQILQGVFVEREKLGCCIDIERATVSEIRRQVEGCLQDKSLRPRLREFRKKARALGGARRAAELVCRLLARKEPPLLVPDDA